MCLAGWNERVCNADVQLRIAHAKPRPAAYPERLGLLQFGEPDQRAVEPARLRLATGRRIDLHVIKDGTQSHSSNVIAGGAARPSAGPPPLLLVDRADAEAAFSAPLRRRCRSVDRGS
jgi:hypothetical protein